MEGRGGSCIFYKDRQGRLTERLTFDLKESEGGATWAVFQAEKQPV